MDSQPARAAASTAPHTLFDLDDAGRLRTEVLCQQCGHNLRGLAPDGNCTECNHAVSLSLRVRVFGSLTESWLAQARRSTGLMLVLLPWIWIPVVWPAITYACWRPTSRIAVRTLGDEILRIAARSAGVVASLLLLTWIALPAWNVRLPVPLYSVVYLPGTIVAGAAVALTSTFVVTRAQRGWPRRMMRRAQWVLWCGCGLSLLMFSFLYFTALLAGEKIQFTTGEQAICIAPAIAGLLVLLVLVPFTLLGTRSLLDSSQMLVTHGRAPTRYAPEHLSPDKTTSPA